MERWIVDNWNDRELSWAIHIWRYLTKFYNTAQSTGFKALLQWHQNEMHKAFVTWRQNARNEISNDVIDVMISSSETASLTSAFQRWRLFTLTGVHVTLAEHRGYQAAYAFSHVKVLSAWNKLRDVSRQYHLMVRSTVQWCGWQLFAALRAWVSLTRESIQQRAMMSGALLTWVKSKLEFYLTHWRKITHQAHICGGVLTKWTETSASIPRTPEPKFSRSPELSSLSPEMREMIKAGLENVRDNPASSPRQLITSLLDWNLRIDDTEITCLDDGSEFVFYHVSVWNIQDNRSKLRVKRMYSDIEVLNRELTDQFPQMFAYDDSPQLPSKRYYGTMDPQFVNSRKVALEKYLQDVIAIPLLAQAQPTRAFFNI